MRFASVRPRSLRRLSLRRAPSITVAMLMLAPVVLNAAANASWLVSLDARSCDPLNEDERECHQHHFGSSHTYPLAALGCFT